MIRDTEAEQLLRDYTRPILRAAGLEKQNIQVVIINEGRIVCEDLRENLTRNASLEEVFLRSISSDTAAREAETAPRSAKPAPAKR